VIRQIVGRPLGVLSVRSNSITSFQFSGISECLNPRSNATNGLLENGVWLLAKEYDNDHTICEFTFENLEEIIDDDEELTSVGESIIELGRKHEAIGDVKMDRD
jgi:hypothetical protein